MPGVPPPVRGEESVRLGDAIGGVGTSSVAKAISSGEKRGSVPGKFEKATAPLFVKRENSADS